MTDKRGGRDGETKAPRGERQKSRRHRQAEARHTERHTHKDTGTQSHTIRGGDAQRLGASTLVRCNCVGSDPSY